MEQIIDGDKILATIFSKNVKTESINFLTPDDFDLQVGLIQHKNGKQVPLHFHNRIKRETDSMNEILYIEKGQVDVIITDQSWSVKKEITLTGGDMIMFIDGGHSVYCHPDARIWEIKQGPYVGDKAKTWK